MPEELKEKLDTQVGIDERAGAELPLDLEFTTPEGTRHALRDFFPGDGKPVVLTFNYADCPTLCSTQLDGLANSMAAANNWTIGLDYRVVTLGLDPTELPERTIAIRDRMVGLYSSGLAADPTRWNFLSGTSEDVQAVADAVGFRYTFHEESGQYLHSPVTILCTPDGRVGRYLAGLQYPGQTFRLSLAETADGELRSAVDRLLLFCFQFDPTANSYVLAAWNFTRLFLSLFAIVLGGILFRQIRRSKPASHPRQA